MIYDQGAFIGRAAQKIAGAPVDYFKTEIDLGLNRPTHLRMGKLPQMYNHDGSYTARKCLVVSFLGRPGKVENLLSISSPPLTATKKLIVVGKVGRVQVIGHHILCNCVNTTSPRHSSGVPLG